ncbi:hypothetical protein ACFWMJ_09200 [Streptomyces hawaiiensis]|uniref:hypothetical protein n=1 Tax=Streptomyces hawaiiensis TaxID=67305 RepID=UPI0036644B55
MGAAAFATRALDLLVAVAVAVAVARALDLRLATAVLILVLLSIEVSNILSTLPGQRGTFEAAVLDATAGFLGQADAVAFALVLHAQQVLPQIPLEMIAMAGKSMARDRPERNSS